VRACLFCHQRVTSKEHVWPVWLLELLSGGRVAIIDAERGDQPLRTWRGVGASLQVKRFCRGCNNGWMSELEGRAKPLLTKLIDGHADGIEPAEQQTLAEWAVKTAMVFEATRVDDHWFYTPEEHQEFRALFRPPVRTSVWIAQHAGFPGAFCKADHLGGEVVAAAQAMAAYVTTAAFGHLVIQVSSAKIPPQFDHIAVVTADQRPGPWDMASARVWPVARDRISWPPLVALDEGTYGVEGFADRWAPL
jgi:hypothetical protein